MSGAPALQITQLNVAYGSGDSLIRAVNHVDLEVRAGESLGIVGESGSGKTQLLLAMLGLSPATAQLSGSVRYRGEELLGAPRRSLNRIRGARIGLVFQDPMTALNPFLRIGTQLIEGLRAHRRVTAAAARRRALELLELVQIAAPELRLRQFPHQLSGGMRQRVLIAMALICEPEILLCDEPTTALDVTVQAQIIALLQELRARTGVTLVLVTHDLGVIAQLAERVAVMYAGRIIEQAPVNTLLTAPRHPYSEGLLRSTLSLTTPVATRLTAMDGNPPDLLLRQTAGQTPWSHHVSQPLLAVEQLSVNYALERRWNAPRLLQAVQQVSFKLQRGHTLGIVGESGSGKSSIARALLRVVKASSGTAIFDGQHLFELAGPALRAARARIQAVFQNPLASLDPRMRVGEIIAEPLREFAAHLPVATRRERVRAMMLRVGLTELYFDAYPHELSGGQAQRVSIARALIPGPELLICDEPLAALDISIRAQIGNLLKELQQQTSLSILLVSHDLAAVRFLCDSVLVLYLGRVMEIATRDALFATPRHPYTRALLQAAPTLSRHVATPLGGEMPSPLAPPSGCVFRTRCPYAVARCAAERPELRMLGSGLVACHRAEEL